MSKHATRPIARRVDRITTQTPMSPAMVDRLFWRAGFGPSDADRKRWTGRTLGATVDWLLNTPAAYSGSPGTDQGKPLDPTGNDDDLVLSWVDQMNRAINPFVERMTFFWHGHWANSRESVSPPQLLMTQTKLFRKYADFANNPKATFHDMAYAVTIDPSMLRYLTGELNVRGAPNENYARELMELFTLGVTNAAGKPNYSQTDVEQLAKALSGWQINDTNPEQGVLVLHAVPVVRRAEAGLWEVRKPNHGRGDQARPQPACTPGVHRQCALGRVHRPAAEPVDVEVTHAPLCQEQHETQAADSGDPYAS